MNQAGLNITSTGCQTLTGSTALALARSRYYEYEVRPGDWEYDGTGDLGRIQRQNAIIEALIDKAKSTYNPITLNSFLGSIVNDVTVDQNMSFGLMLSLAETYHAFSGSALQTYTLPTAGRLFGRRRRRPGRAGAAGAAGDLDVPRHRPQSVVTPPLDAYGNAGDGAGRSTHDSAPASSRHRRARQRRRLPERSVQPTC